MVKRPSRNRLCMDIARVVAYRGTCSRAQVGVVIALEGRVLVTGYNGAPAGMRHCNHECKCGANNYVDVPEAAQHIISCPAHHENVCTVTTHAEANAIAFAAKHGVATDGAELYTTLSPCLACAKLIVNAGIVRVWIGDSYHSQEGIVLLQNAGIDWQMLV